MLERVLLFFKKFRNILFAIAAGVVVWIALLKIVLKDGINNSKNTEDELELRKKEFEKLNDKMKKLEQEKQAKLSQIDADKSISEAKLKKNEQTLKEKLVKLSSEDDAKFKSELESRLGITEKKE